MTARRLVDQSESTLRSLRFPEVAGNTRPQHLREHESSCTVVQSRLRTEVACNTSVLHLSPKPLEFKWPLELTGHWLSARIVSQPSQVVCSLPPALPLEEGGINKLYL